MKLKNKTIASLLTMTLLFASVQILSTAIVHADVIELTWLTHWTDPRETGYWDGVFAKYEALNPNIHITMVGVTFDVLLQEITLRHASDTDTDIIHFYDMWLPQLANHVSEVMAPAPADIVTDVNPTNWQSKSIKPSTYKSILYGYPTEYDCWTLVYNRMLFQRGIDEGKTELIPILAKLEHRDANGAPDQPLTWDEFETAARALAKWEDGTLIETGFLPMTVAAQGRFQFLSMLWSNGGDYYDLSVPEVLFDTQNAYDAMQLLSDLGYEEPRAYDPLNMPDYWWGAWVDETVAMMMLPTWMTYIRGAMGAKFFTDLGIAPVPYNDATPGAESVSNSYGWMVGVSEKATIEDGGVRADAAWDFLRWLNTPRAAGYIESPTYMAEAYGAVPKGDPGDLVTIMGDWLIFDSIIPSKIGDQINGHITGGYYDVPPHGYDGGPLSGDFWMKGYMDIANIYGRPSIDNLKSAQIDAEINLMFDRVVLTGADPTVEVHEAAQRVSAVLPISGDIDLNGEVDIFEVVFLIDAVTTPAATPGSSKWVRGRCDFNDDGIVDVLDIAIYIQNFGRTGDP
jgi:ABC-type glycerol-3-phosphate transport system substrate-binding protein